MKRILTEWANATTAHGINNIIRSNHKFIKVIWILFFLASASYCIYTIIESLTLYFQYETTISISELHESPTQYPSVTICNKSPFYTNSRYNETVPTVLLLKNILAKYNFTLNFTQGGFSSTNNPLALYSNFYKILMRISANEFKLSSITDKYNLGYKLSDHMLLSCFFNGKSCNTSDFALTWNDLYGNCYTFNNGFDFYGNTKSIEYTSVPGPEFGLKLEILTGLTWSLNNLLHLSLLANLTSLQVIRHQMNSKYQTASI